MVTATQGAISSISRLKSSRCSNFWLDRRILKLSTNFSLLIKTSSLLQTSITKSAKAPIALSVTSFSSSSNSSTTSGKRCSKDFWAPIYNEMLSSYSDIYFRTSQLKSWQIFLIVARKLLSNFSTDNRLLPAASSPIRRAAEALTFIGWDRLDILRAS